MDATPKVLSYFLPQFYQIPLNDEWHGEGFTEWTKVRASKSLFEGHSQPRTPMPSLGYYKLDEPETLRKQVRLMKRGRVHGQIFYHYWFAGTMILERPSQLLLENPDIDMPFAFCWANESWSKRWDGESGEVILGQSYSLEDAEKFMQYLIPFFTDSRYVKVNGRPLLFIYRAHDIPGLGLLVQVWNSICLENNLDIPYLVSVQTGDNLDAAISGFAAEAERPTYHLDELRYIPEIASADFEHKGKILDYESVSSFYQYSNKTSFLPLIPGVVVSWDQSPRHAANALILENRSPEAYRRWLTDALNYSATHFKLGERFVTVNAWNEWAEGAYLEPDTEFGFQFLDANARAVSEWEVTHGA